MGPDKKIVSTGLDAKWFLGGLLLCQIIEVWHEMSDKIRHHKIKLHASEGNDYCESFRVIAIRAFYDG